MPVPQSSSDPHAQTVFEEILEAEGLIPEVIDEMTGYLQREGDTWKLYRNIQREEWVQGAASDLLARREFISPGLGDSVIYVRGEAGITLRRRAECQYEEHLAAAGGTPSTPYHQGTAYAPPS